jgi:predicted DNA-binding protein YlxM (UPF0122 family)
MPIYTPELLTEASKIYAQLPEYRVWLHMKDRCNKKECKEYPNYGGRGIKICDEWNANFENFFTDMGPRPDHTYSLDRIDNDGDYEPDNCRWANRNEQYYNKQQTKLVNLPGYDRPLTTREAAEILNINEGTLYSRLHRGKDLLEPVKVKNNFYEYKGSLYKLDQLHKFSSVSKSVLSTRLAEGWSVDKAVETPLAGTTKYLCRGEHLTIPEIADKYDLKDFNIRHYVRKDIAMDDIIDYMLDDLVNDDRLVPSRVNIYELHGKRYTVAGLSKIGKLPASVITNRLNLRWPIERAVYTPIMEVDKYLCKGEYLTIPEMARLYNVAPRTIRYHMQKGIEPTDIINYYKEGIVKTGYAFNDMKTYTYQGREYTTQGLALISDVSLPAITRRLANGWTVEDAISVPVDKQKTYLCNNEYLTVQEISEKYNITETTIRHYVRKEISPDTIVQYYNNGIVLDEKIVPNNSKIYDYNGTKYVISGLAKLTTVPKNVISDRIASGWSVERAISEGNHSKPVENQTAIRERRFDNLFNSKVKTYHYGGTDYTLSGLVKLTGLPIKTINGRLERGWSVEQIVETPKNEATTYTYQGNEYTIGELSAILGYDKHRLEHHFKNGKSVEETLELFKKAESKGKANMWSNLYEYRGKKYTLGELSKETGVKKSMLATRLKRGMSVEDAVNTPEKVVAKYFYNGQEMSIRQIAIETKSDPKRLKTALKDGLSMEDAIDSAKVLNPRT